MKEKQIWVYAELSSGKLINVYYELLAKAKKLAEEMEDASVAAVVLGNDISEAVEILKESGAEAVYVIDHARLKAYNCQGYACAFEQLIKKYNPYMILVGATAVGAELAPTIAAKVKTGLAAHCIDIKLGEDRVNCMIPAFGGKVVSEIYVPDARPIMASIRAGIIEALQFEPVDDVDVIYEDGAFLDECPVMEELIEFVPAPPIGKDILGANVVVAAGRGVNESAWNSMQDFAYRIGAPIGWSRSFVDTGLVEDESQMIGTSGKSIKPKLFIGFGISGAIHFTGGMSKSKTIISINKDKNAPMFKSSDYGVVGDADKILKKLLAKFG